MNCTGWYAFAGLVLCQVGAYFLTRKMCRIFKLKPPTVLEYITVGFFNRKGE